MIKPPRSETELTQRVNELAGNDLQNLANRANWNVPVDLKRDKGWIGQLLEKMLGATAGNLSKPDFPQLGIELKTIPLTRELKAKETTYVCTVPLLKHIGLLWEDSCVFRKLSRVLWIPIEADPDIPLYKRKVGSGFFWSPDSEDWAILQTDWEEFMEIISLGQVDTLTAHQGEYLQIRPKAANASVVTESVGSNGLYKPTLPRGFYLRTTFTNQILNKYFS